MGNCCQNDNNREIDSDKYLQGIPAPIPQDSKKNSLIDPTFAKLNHKESKSNIGQTSIHINGVIATLQTNRNSFASTPHQSGLSPKDVGFLSHSKNNITEYSSFISGLQPYKEKEITQRIQSQQLQNYGETTGRSQFARESIIQRSSMKDFYIITSIYTPTLTNQKINLYKQFIQYMESLSCRVITIEYATISSPFLVTEDNFQPYHFQIRLEDPIFLRFNTINHILKKLPDSWEWIGIIDYNVEFENERWIDNTQECLRQNRIVQLFEECKEIKYNDNTQMNKYGIVNFIQNNTNRQPLDMGRMQFYLEGGKAWAFRRDFYLEYDYLIDICITGYEETLFSLCLSGLCTTLLKSYLNEETYKLLQKFEQIYKNEQNSQSYIPGQIKCVLINPDTQRYSLLEAVNLLNQQITNLYTDNSSIIHIRSLDQKDHKEDIKFLSKILL